MMGKCAKLTTIAVLVNGKDHWVATNECNNPQLKCPRKDMPTGEGYEMCRDVCRQTGHAEANVCRKAGDGALGAHLYLIGHSYICEDCMKIMNMFGVREYTIMNANNAIHVVPFWTFVKINLKHWWSKLKGIVCR